MNSALPGSATSATNPFLAAQNAMPDATLAMGGPSGDSGKKGKHIRTEGEKRFDGLVYNGIGYILNAAISVVAMMFVKKSNAGKAFIDSTAKTLNVDRKAVEQTSLLTGGWAVLIPMKLLEDKKVEMVEKWDREIYGDKVDTDEQIKLLIARGAVIGAALDAWMLYPGWIRGKTQPSVVGLEAVADHMDHVCQLAGNARHCAIGSDLDGGFGIEQTPNDLDTITDLQKLAGILAKRGYSDADIDGIFFGNWLRFFRAALPAK